MATRADQLEMMSRLHFQKLAALSVRAEGAQRMGRVAARSLGIPKTAGVAGLPRGGVRPLTDEELEKLALSFNPIKAVKSGLQGAKKFMSTLRGGGASSKAVLPKPGPPAPGRSTSAGTVAATPKVTPSVGAAAPPASAGAVKTPPPGAPSGAKPGASDSFRPLEPREFHPSMRSGNAKSYKDTSPFRPISSGEFHPSMRTTTPGAPSSMATPTLPPRTLATSPPGGGSVGAVKPAGPQPGMADATEAFSSAKTLPPNTQARAAIQGEAPTIAPGAQGRVGPPTKAVQPPAPAPSPDGTVNLRGGAPSRPGPARDAQGKIMLKKQTPAERKASMQSAAKMRPGRVVPAEAPASPAAKPSKDTRIAASQRRQEMRDAMAAEDLQRWGMDPGTVDQLAGGKSPAELGLEGANAAGGAAGQAGQAAAQAGQAAAQAPGVTGHINQALFGQKSLPWSIKAPLLAGAATLPIGVGGAALAAHSALQPRQGPHVYGRGMPMPGGGAF